MILGGIWLIISNHNVRQIAINNIKNYNNKDIFFSNGLLRCMMSLPVVVFSFTGLNVYKKSTTF